MSKKERMCAVLKLSSFFNEDTTMCAPVICEKLERRTLMSTSVVTTPDITYFIPSGDNTLNVVIRPHKFIVRVNGGKAFVEKDAFVQAVSIIPTPGITGGYHVINMRASAGVKDLTVSVTAPDNAVNFINVFNPMPITAQGGNLSNNTIRNYARGQPFAMSLRGGDKSSNTFYSTANNTEEDGGVSSYNVFRGKIGRRSTETFIGGNTSTNEFFIGLGGGRYKATGAVQSTDDYYYTFTKPGNGDLTAGTMSTDTVYTTDGSAPPHYTLSGSFMFKVA